MTRPRPTTRTTTAGVAVLAILAGLLSVLTAPPTSAGPTAAALEVRVHPTRADLVSGGDVLAEVVLPGGAAAEEVTVDVDGRDVTDAFAVRDDGRLMGIVDSLVEGSNRIRAALPDGRSGVLDVTNHPIGGPVFTGPQIHPWPCVTEEEGLGPPSDDQCNVDPVVTWYYRDAVSGQFLVYDPDAPAPDSVIATVATDEGDVPFIVRLEEGVLNRGIYAVAVVADPAADPSPWARPRGWNGTLAYQFGGGSNPHYGQAAAPSILDPTALSAGYLVAGSSLNVHGNNVQDNVAAETVMMMKEHITETYGPITHTFGTGCSGGSLQQYLMPSLYPGLLDGLIPSCSFPDLWTEFMEITDCHLLERYFEAAPELWPDPTAQYDVMGKGEVDGCRVWASTYASLGSPTADDAFKDCGIPEEQVYDPQTNPEGPRCSIADYQRNIWGARPPEVWTEVEQQIGRGFAPRAYDNVGVQYGLASLEAGTITAAQFVDLNSRIGGFDIDAQPIPERTVADRSTLETAYRTGQVSDATFWADVPIIDLRGHSTIEWHQDWSSYSARARLDAANGHHDNQVIWTGATPIIGDPAFACGIPEARSDVPGLGATAIPPELCTANPMHAMDRWLRAIAADPSDDPLADKVVRNRPADVVDACWIAGAHTTDAEACAAAYPPNSAPRIVAGTSLEHDILKCQLAPLVRSAYPVEFSEEEWGLLQAAFPDGVCDWSQPGVGQQPAQAWQTFADGPGGTPLPPPPVSEQFTADAIHLVRHGGADRVATAVEVSGRGRAHADVAVLARADEFADALTGGPLAVALDAPLLLTGRDLLSPTTRRELRRLGVTEVVLLGGEAALGPQVEADIVAMGVSARRLAGADRYATAALVAQELPAGAEAMVVRGDRFPDAVAAGSLASMASAPVVLVEQDGIPASSAEALQGRRAVTIVGGPDAVGPAVATALAQQGASVARLAGDDRYGTAIAVADEAGRRGLASAETTWVASGADFPDALAAGAAAGRAGAVLLLVSRDVPLPGQTAAFLDQRRDEIRTVRVAGGTAAVSGAVVGGITGLLDG